LRESVVFVDPLTPRLEVVGSTLVGDRVKRPDSDLRMERNVDVSNLSGVLVLVAEADVTAAV
jgi:hypothetical protein